MTVWILCGNGHPEAAFDDEALASTALAELQAREEQHRADALAQHTYGQGNVFWHLHEVPFNPGK